jgi:hypothetical protein
VEEHGEALWLGRVDVIVGALSKIRFGLRLEPDARSYRGDLLLSRSNHPMRMRLTSELPPASTLKAMSSRRRTRSITEQLDDSSRRPRRGELIASLGEGMRSLKFQAKQMGESPVRLQPPTSASGEGRHREGERTERHLCQGQRSLTGLVENVDAGRSG